MSTTQAQIASTNFRERRPRRSVWSESAAALAVAVFFVAVSWRAAYVHFSGDEMMNIGWYWEPGGWKVARACVVLWSKIIRPMGGIYYLPLFHAFGLNPWPFTVVRLAILLGVSFLFLRLGVRLTGSLAAAATGVMVAVYHPELVSLTHCGSFIYDILCAGFYVAALLYYLRIRDRGRRLGFFQCCVFLALYMCALDSKEMAVSLPIMVCAFELMEALRGTRNITTITGRLVTHVWPLAAAVALTLVFVIFKTYAPYGLARMDAYRPVFTWASFAVSSQRFLNAIFCTTLFRTWSVLSLWGVLLYVGIRKRNRGLLLLLTWVVATPLPLNFIPPHGPGCIYIPLAGWSMIVAMACTHIARRIAREPILAWLPQDAAVVAILFAGLCYYTSVTAAQHERCVRYFFRNGEKTWNMIEQFRSLPLHPPHGSRIVFLNDPFPEGWDVYFIAKLWWNDPSLQVSLQNQQHLTPGELAHMDYVFDFPQGRLTRR